MLRSKNFMFASYKSPDKMFGRLFFINLFAGLFWGGPDFGVSGSEPGLESESLI